MKFIKKNRCFIVAELSGNHDGKLNNLLKMIRQAKIAGADAVKIQAYEADRITMNSDKKFLSLGQQANGKNITVFTNYIKKLKHQNIGTRKYFYMQKKLKLQYLLLCLI